MSEKPITKHERISLRDVVFMGALAVAAVAPAALGANFGHTHAERVHSGELLEAEGLVGLVGLEVAGFKAGAQLLREHQEIEQARNGAIPPVQVRL